MFERKTNKEALYIIKAGKCPKCGSNILNLKAYYDYITLLKCNSCDLVIAIGDYANIKLVDGNIEDITEME